MRDPYEVLGVPRTASEGDIKRAYRRLAKKHHPDQNTKDPKAKDRFSEVNGAHEILGDEAKRKSFDRGEIDAAGKPRFRANEGFGGATGGNRGGFEGFEFGFGPGGPAGGPTGRRAGGGDPFADMFAQAFSGAQAAPGRARPQPPADIEIEASVTLENIVGGQGLRVTVAGGKVLSVALPPGVTNGQRIRLKGQGKAAAHGGPAGDVIIAVSVAPHPLFRVEGADIYIDLPLSLDEAVFGGPVRVPTLTGTVELQTPAGANNGQTLRLRGKGLPGKSGQGDLFAILRIVLPSDDQGLVKLAENIRKAGSYKARGPAFG